MGNGASFENPADKELRSAEVFYHQTCNTRDGRPHSLVPEVRLTKEQNAGSFQSRHVLR